MSTPSAVSRHNGADVATVIVASAAAVISARASRRVR